MIVGTAADLAASNSAWVTTVAAGAGAGIAAAPPSEEAEDDAATGAGAAAAPLSDEAEDDAATGAGDAAVAGFAGGGAPARHRENKPVWVAPPEATLSVFCAELTDGAACGGRLLVDRGAMLLVAAAFVELGTGVDDIVITSWI